MALTNATFRISVAPQFATTFGTFSPTLQQVVTSLQFGTAANQSDLLYFKTRNASTGGDSIDLNADSLLQPDQTTFSALQIVGIAIANRDASATLTVGGGSNAVANISAVILPNGVWGILAPGSPAYPVVAGTGDILKVVSSAGTPVYDIVILARSA